MPRSRPTRLATRYRSRKALKVLVDEGTAEMSPGMGTYVKASG